MRTVRLAGVTHDARGFGPSDHLCWAYEAVGDFRDRVLEFLDDGLALGQRVCYTAAGGIERLLDDLRALDGLEAGLARGAIHVRSLDRIDPDGVAVDGYAQVHEYSEQTSMAREDGFTGFRMATEATPLVRTPSRLEAFTRYEHLVDRFMAAQPFTAMCAYDRRELGPKLISQIACMHPNSNDPAAQFRLYASSHAAAALGGEIDINTRELFPLALERARLEPTDGELVIDARGLSVIDHRSVITLGEYAAARGTVAVLRTATPGPARIVEVLELTDVRVEPPL